MIGRSINFQAGQQQRVALARALVIRPRLFAASMNRSRISTPSCASKCAAKSGGCARSRSLTAIYVTHDQKEAPLDRRSSGDHGKARHIRQVGKPAEVYRAPTFAFRRRLHGRNQFRRRPAWRTCAMATCCCGNAVAALSRRRSAGRTWKPQPGDAATLSIRPESWKLGAAATAPNALAGRLGERVYLGEMAQYQFAAGAHTLKIFELNPRYVELSPERELYASVEPEDAVALPG